MPVEARLSGEAQARAMPEGTDHRFRPVARDRASGSSGMADPKRFSFRSGRRSRGSIPSTSRTALPPAESDRRGPSGSDEFRGALSRTRTTAPDAPTNAPGRRVGLVGSWESQAPWYATAGHALEFKSFSTRVAGASLELDTEERLVTVGGGRV